MGEPAEPVEVPTLVYVEATERAGELIIIRQDDGEKP